MDENLINDIRTEFRNITFSNFQKSKVKKELLNSMYNSKIENSCYWAAELICAGHYLDLWDIIIFYYFSYIHIGNPKLAIYLNLRYNNFITILKNGYNTNILPMRNNLKIRKLFSEIICILCFSIKKHNINTIKLNKETDFDLINMSEKFKAPNTNYALNIIKEEDPKELFIPVNELVYSLVNKNIIDSCYWFEWIIEYESICKKKKQKSKCDLRDYAPKGFNHDFIWIIWDILFYYSNPNNENDLINNNNQEHGILKLKQKIINEMFSLFTIKYNNSHNRKRKHIIYFGFSLLIENIDFSKPILNNEEKINAIVQKINAIYKDIKKNEISPGTDYLFNNLKKSNLEKTIEKIEMINNI